MVLHILKFLFVLVEVLVLFNLIVIAHELGHFLAARWRGLYIEEFGVWFGKPIWKKKINGVWYSLGCIPAGGFVKLPQLAPMEALEGATEAPLDQLKPISQLDKIITAFAGPLFSFGFAIVLACLVWSIGKPTSEVETSTVIGYVEPGAPADKAGLLPGDKILKVDGHPVKRFAGMVNSINWFVVRSEGTTIPFEIERDGKTLTLESGWSKAGRKGWGREGLRQVHIGPASAAKIGEIEPKGPASEAGLLAGDIITHVNGNRIYSRAVLSETLEKQPDAPVALTIERGNTNAAPLHVTVQPKQLASEQGPKRPRIGIVWAPESLVLTYPTPYQQIADSVTSIGNMVGALFSPKSDVKAQHFSGPVGIMRLYYNLFESEQGWRMALWFSVFFNVNLAILNLLPIPVLDGGHIVLALLESIRRKPVNLKALEIVQTACALLLMGYMAYVTFFDVQDLPWQKLKPAPAVPAQTGK